MRSGHLLLCFALLCSAPLAHGQASIVPSKGTEFWFGFMRNYGGWEPPYVLEVYISSAVATTGTVSIPRSGHQWPFTTVPGMATTISIPVDAGITQGSEYVDDRGIHVLSEDPIAVYALNYESYTSEGTVVYPVPSLGTEYRVFAYSAMNPGPGLASEFLIVATKDGTEVEITSTQVTAGGHMPGQPWVVQLDSGQTYQVQAFNPLHDLTGSTVRATDNSGSCRPFAVFGGSACAEVPTNCWACDHLFEQMFPVAMWGTSYHTVPFISTTSYLYRVMADQDGTQVSVNGGAPTTLAAGQYIDDLMANSALHIQADKPIGVAQYMKGNLCVGNGDPSMLVLNSDGQHMDEVTFTTVTSTVINDHYLNIVVSAGEVGNVLLDGVPLPASVFTPFATDPFMMHATVPVTEGSHDIACSGGFIAYAYGIGGEESYAYAVGANMVVPVPPFQEVFCGAGPEGTVTMAPPVPLDGPYWYAYHDPDSILHYGSEFTITPSVTQVYAVNGTQPVSGCPVQYLFSVELDVPPELTLSASDTSVCAYAPVLLSVVAGPMGNYQYNWQPGNTVQGADGASALAHPLVDTWYSVTVSTPSGCATATDSVLVRAMQGGLAGLTLVPDQALLCQGEQVQLSAGAMQLLHNDDFDAGLAPFWLNAQGWELSADCGSVSGTALHFNGGGDRFVETQDLDLSGGGELRYALVIGSGAAPCEDADPGDDVLLEYSTDAGTNWVQLAFHVQWAYPEPTPISIAIPAAAQTTATRLRWRQQGSWGVGEDNWALDAVAIVVPSNSGILFQWTPAAGLSSAAVPAPTAFPASTAWYTVTASDAAVPCTFSDSLLITVVSAQADILPLVETLCEDGSAVLSAEGVGDVEWNTGETSPTIVVDVPGIYWVQVMVQDCAARDSVQVSWAPQPDGLEISMPLCQGSEWTLEIPLEGGQYLWSTGDTTRSIVVQGEGNYSFSVVDPYGCQYTGQVALEPGEDSGNVWMPNVFTPNSDGQNDRFMPMGDDDPALRVLRVYNRWGQLLFEGAGAAARWDGRTNGQALPEGTYYYVLDHGSACSGTMATQKGVVTLLR